MTKRILVVPDVHGRTFWKEPVNSYLNTVDRVVFLGDYLDPYRDEGVRYDLDDINANLMEIISLKQNNMDKIVLLKGNHDQHYASVTFNKLACGSRKDKIHWDEYHQQFQRYDDLFQIAYFETVGETPYIFSHAGVTVHWLNKVNAAVWHLPDNELSLADPLIADRINQLDTTDEGQQMLSVVGQSRSWFGGEKTGGILWADVNDHPLCPSDAYGIDKVFQVFGHSRIHFESMDMVCTGCFAMIDSQQCFMIDESLQQKIVPISKFKA